MSVINVDYSTKIPNIEVYSAFPPSTQRFIRWTRPIAPLLGTAPIQKLLKARIKSGPPGPTPEQRARVEAKLKERIDKPEAMTRLSRTSITTPPSRRRSRQPSATSLRLTAVT